MISGLLQLVTCCELLLSQHSARLGKGMSLVHQALVWCLVCSHSKVRIAAQASTKKLVSGLGGAQLATDLLNSLTTLTANNKIQVSISQRSRPSLFHCLVIIMASQDLHARNENDLFTSLFLICVYRCFS